MADAENNLIKKTHIAKVRELDYAQRFGESIASLIDMMGISRKIPVVAGTVLKALKVTGSLESGSVAEGDTIPLSQYQTTYTSVGEITLKKWRKAASGEAILKGGYEQAVNDTDAKMILDIQKSIRSAFITYLASGTGTATGTTFQAALANAWANLAIAFDDDSVNAVYFVNPLDVASYLGSANITVQSAFGLNYIKDFLGLGTVILNGSITQGTFYATAAENIVLYYVDVNGADGFGEAFDFTTDSATGFIGIKEVADYDRLTCETTAVAGVTIFAEMLDGVIVGTIGETPDPDPDPEGGDGNGDANGGENGGAEG